MLSKLAAELRVIVGADGPTTKQTESLSGEDAKKIRERNSLSGTS